MGKLTELKRRLKEVVDAKPNEPIFGVVTAVNNDTCSVHIEGLELTDVRLKPITGGDERLLLIPAIGSDVTMLSANDSGLENLEVIKIDRLEKVEIIENGFEFHVDFKVKKVGFGTKETDIYGVFNQLSTLLKQLKVYTPSGPSGTPLPDSIVRIEKFETDFKKILKSI